MKKRTEGAWIIHHTKKLQDVTRSADFEEVELAGKCGLLLSSLAASDEESTLSPDKVNAISVASNINRKLELPVIKETLKDAQLIDISSDGSVSVLGITSSNILEHTSSILYSSSVNSFQKASLELANYSSDKPVVEKELIEYIGDTFKLDTNTNTRLFTQSEEIGLIDSEKLGKEKLFFNGNLFKRESIEKTSKVLSTLSSEEMRRVTELDEAISKNGCVTKEYALKLLGNILLVKLQSIAMYDFNEVSNNIHSKIFLTKPSSFSKFGNPFEDDALDLAKAFISSLMYGMKVSTQDRGSIVDLSMIQNTLRKLLRGGRVGPCTAIGQDYKTLEMNRVIELVHSTGSMYFMRLLKYDIARLALDVLEKGDLADTTTLGGNVNGSDVSMYAGPEENRDRLRRKTRNDSAVNVSEILRTMRG